MNFDIEKHTILRVIHGSHAYGLATPESDIDIRGVAIPPKEYFHGWLHKFSQYSENKNDTTIFDIRKFFELAAKVNPNIIEILYVPDDCIQKITKEGEKIIEHRELFLSQKVRYTFCGYAYAQLKRIKQHRHWLLNPVDKKPRRSDFGLPNQSVLSSEIRGAIESFLKNDYNYHIEGLDLNNIIDRITAIVIGNLFSEQLNGDQLNKLTETGEILSLAANFGKDVMSAFIKERAYHAALTNWKQYQNWKATRNPKRAKIEKEYGLDLKHATHLARLLRMGKEIMEGKGVIVRRPDREELLDILHGKWTYDQLVEYAENMEREIDELYKSKQCRLPYYPPTKKLDEICNEVVCSFLKV